MRAIAFAALLLSLSLPASPIPIHHAQLQKRQVPNADGIITVPVPAGYGGDFAGTDICVNVQGSPTIVDCAGASPAVDGTVGEVPAIPVGPGNPPWQGPPAPAPSPWVPEPVPKPAPEPEWQQPPPDWEAPPPEYVPPPPADPILPSPAESPAPPPVPEETWVPEPSTTIEPPAPSTTSVEEELVTPTDLPLDVTPTTQPEITRLEVIPISYSSEPTAITVVPA